MTHLSTPAKTASPWFNDKVYNVLKFIAQILLPALGALYVAVSGLWGLPATEQVLGTVVAVDTFLGIILGISSAQYNALEGGFDGTMVVTQHDDDTGTIQLLPKDHPSTLAGKKSVTFKVDSAIDTQVFTTPGDLPSVNSDI